MPPPTAKTAADFRDQEDPDKRRQGEQDGRRDPRNDPPPHVPSSGNSYRGQSSFAQTPRYTPQYHPSTSGAPFPHAGPSNYRNTGQQSDDDDNDNDDDEEDEDSNGDDESNEEEDDEEEEDEGDEYEGEDADEDEESDSGHSGAQNAATGTGRNSAGSDAQRRSPHHEPSPEEQRRQQIRELLERTERLYITRGFAQTIARQRAENNIRALLARQPPSETSGLSPQSQSQSQSHSQTQSQSQVQSQSQSQSQLHSATPNLALSRDAGMEALANSVPRESSDPFGPLRLETLLQRRGVPSDLARRVAIHAKTGMPLRAAMERSR